jgi:hypothetical protein
LAFSTLNGIVGRLGAVILHPLSMMQAIGSMISSMSQNNWHACFSAPRRGESSRNRSFGGTGLGLPIALSIIKTQHGGTIEIGDAPHGVARVIIKLPRARGNSKAYFLEKEFGELQHGQLFQQCQMTHPAVGM